MRIYDDYTNVFRQRSIQARKTLRRPTERNF